MSKLVAGPNVDLPEATSGITPLLTTVPSSRLMSILQAGALFTFKMKPIFEAMILRTLMSVPSMPVGFKMINGGIPKADASNVLPFNAGLHNFEPSKLDHELSIEEFEYHTVFDVTSN